MAGTDREPLLLTPGPLTTSATVKQAMLRDWGSRDGAFIALNRRVRERLLALAGGTDSHVCVPVQGSGTVVVEAMLGTLVPRDGKLLVLVNGAYGRRMATIAAYHGRACETLEWPEDAPTDPAALDRRLAGDRSISHVAVVHCETTSGILNPLREVAAVVARHGRSLLIDSMSAFGALPLDAREIAFDAMVASSNKCLGGVPGVGLAILRRLGLPGCQGNTPDASAGLWRQVRAM